MKGEGDFDLSPLTFDLQFDETFGVYAYPNPMAGLFHVRASWSKRIKTEREPISGVKVIVPHYVDLVVSKISSGRPKDREFVMQAMKVFQVSSEQIEELLQEFFHEVPDTRNPVSKTWRTWKPAI